ncbi:enoyl-CoA hydratase/isomerase family protein [Microbacterium timonense]|uniref:enoyl-CoA hydratase/isomerase family protein n=1 Tax=Microbacterium timonense TaxID=2086576 RepID=UPI000D0E6156|nr:enoyl-CoA hydratase-related protein [Microbacterium timonense]
MTDSIILSDRRDDVAILTINRPGVYNALNGAVLAGLESGLAEATASGARAVIVTGTGEKAFSAGADLDEFAGLDSATAQDRLLAGQRVMDAVESSTIPVIAAVNGVALGGGFELVLACTFSVLSTKASLGLPESGLGLIPGYGGTQRLPRAVGRAVAAHLMLSGARMGPDRAYQLGLTPVPPVEPEALLAEALGVAGTLTSKGPRAQRAILAALRTSAPSAMDLHLEAVLGAIATGGSEAAEGIGAFREKRAPRFGEGGRP